MTTPSPHRSSAATMARIALCAAFLSGAALSLSACNTVRGAGQDVSSVGHDVSRGATASQNAIDSHTPASRN